jgi:hypothetical protein
VKIASTLGRRDQPWICPHLKRIGNGKAFWEVIPERRTSTEVQQRSASSDWFLQANVYVANLPLDEHIGDKALVEKAITRQSAITCPSSRFYDNLPANGTQTTHGESTESAFCAGLSIFLSERNYFSDAPSRREERYCVGDIPKEALNDRLKWAESLKPHL